MMEEIVLVGFGGHAKSIADAVERQGYYKIIGYTDVEDRQSRYKFLGNDDALEEIFDMGVKNAIIALGYLGSGHVREKIYDKLKKIGYTLPIIIDPSAIISDTVKIDEGTFIGKGAIINSEADIGKCCIINSGSIIEHECTINDFSHIAVGTVLCGQVKIGKAVFVGANSTVIQSVEVFDREMIPAGITIRHAPIVFGSVIYNAAIDFLDEFIESINKQKNEQFDLLLINDDIKDETIIERIKKKVRKRRVIVRDYTEFDYSPAELRVELLRQAKVLGYGLVVLGDCDDTFSNNRVDCIVDKYYKNRDVAFFYNDLISENVSVFSNIPEHIIGIETMMQVNFVGMSTSAINLKSISFEFIDSLREFNGFVFDWYLFSRILLENNEGVFVPDATTFYGIHDNNYVGINDGSKALIEKEIGVKKKHYQALAKYSSEYAELLKKIDSVNINNIDVQIPAKNWWSNIVFRKE